MQLQVEKATARIAADVICRFGLADTKDARVREILALQMYEGKAGQVALVPGTADGAAWEAYVGIGEVTGEALREAVGNALQAALSVGAKSVVMMAPVTAELRPDEAGQAMTEAALLKTYRYTAYKEAPKKVVEVVTFVVDGKDRVNFLRGVDRAKIVVDGVTLARDLVNAPPKDVHPQELADTAKRIAAQSKGRIKVKILERDACAKLGMESFLAVARGSVFPPKFIHLTYMPAKASKMRLAIVGKGITFDSGGLSLKPADAMMTMKCDMGGAAAVLGFFATLAALAPKAEVHGIIAAAENMPSGDAMRPGDVVRAANGKTIEILNTDAEGRMTLADALDYAVKLEPDAIVDLATLTGACVVGLGEEITGLMSNDDEVTENVLAAAERAGEKMWEMPLEPRYRPLIESDVADLRNIATSRYGGSLTAGLFLQEFVDEVPWAHLDIAGPAFAERPMSSYLSRGGTGHGVRTLVELLEHYK